jgi:hypothetical protein
LSATVGAYEAKTHLPGPLARVERGEPDADLAHAARAAGVHVPQV